MIYPPPPPETLPRSQRPRRRGAVVTVVIVVLVMVIIAVPAVASLLVIQAEERRLAGYTETLSSDEDTASSAEGSPQAEGDGEEIRSPDGRYIYRVPGGFRVIEEISSENENPRIVNRSGVAPGRNSDPLDVVVVYSYELQRSVEEMSDKDIEKVITDDLMVEGDRITARGDLEIAEDIQAWAVHGERDGVFADLYLMPIGNALVGVQCQSTKDRETIKRGCSELIDSLTIIG